MDKVFTEVFNVWDQSGLFVRYLIFTSFDEFRLLCYYKLFFPADSYPTDLNCFLKCL